MRRQNANLHLIFDWWEDGTRVSDQMNDLKLENDKNDKKTVIMTFQYTIIKVLSLPGRLKNPLETDLDIRSLEPFFQMRASQSAMV